MRNNKLVFVIGSALLVVAYFSTRSSDVIRFNVRIDVPTANGVVSNSGTWEATISRNPFSKPASFSAKLRGEGIVVALPQGGALVATLRAAGPENSIEADQTLMLPEQFFRDRAEGLLSPENQISRGAIISEIASHAGWSAMTSYSSGLAAGKSLPYLVYFNDREAPATVEPATGNAALQIGDPMVTITITDDDVTTGIEDQLPWLRTLSKTQKLDGKKYDVLMRSGLANRLGAGSFSTEL